MIRVKDADKSLKFYQDVLGMSLVRTAENPEAKFNLYFLGYASPQATAAGDKTPSREGLLELTWNYGTEKDPSFKYHNGNDQPQGFGHICALHGAPTGHVEAGPPLLRTHGIRTDGEQAFRWTTLKPRASVSKS